MGLLMILPSILTLFKIIGGVLAIVVLVMILSSR
jgi:hypothetical protein